MRVLYSGQELTLSDIALSDGPVGTRMFSTDLKGRPKWLVHKARKERHPTWTA